MSAEQATTPPGTEDVEQDELFFGLSAARLRARATWGAALLLLSVGLPYEVVDDRAAFLWDLAPELPPGALGAAFAVPLAGLAVLVGRLATRRATSLAAIVLASLAAVVALRRLGGERAAWDVGAVPDSLSDRPAGALLALALVAAAGHLSFRPRARRAARWVTWAALASALWFYVLPARGEAPLSLVVRALSALPDLPDVRFQIGLLLIAFLALWPLGVALAGLLIAKLPAQRDTPWISILATWGLPALLAMLAYRALVMAQGSVGVLAFVASVALVAAVLALVSAAVVVAVEGLFVEHGDVAPASRGALEEDAFGKVGAGTAGAAASPGVPPRVALAAGLGAVVAITAVQAALARPPHKGTEWSLGAATPEGDRVFRDALRDWTAARRAWDFAAQREAGAEGRVEVKARGRELVEAAKALDPGVGAAIGALVSESDELDLGGRKWMRLVEDVNEATRAAGLPYYVDPTVLVGQTQSRGVVRHFYTHAYRVEAVSRWDVDGDDYATLRVRALGHARDAHFRLGFSSDASPFALVVLDETERSGADWAAQADAALCTRERVVAEALYAGLDACGQRFRDACGGQEDEVKQATLDAVERHELQHQVDGPHLVLSPRVLTALEGASPEVTDRVNREVSAYLAGMTAPGLAPRLTLVRLVEFVLVNPRGTYGRAGLVALEALADRDLTRAGALDGEAFWDAFRTLSESDDALRDRARAAWEREYDARLPSPAPR